MRIEFSPEAFKDLKKIKRKNKQLFQKIEKQLNLFRENQKHPSLRIHKLKGKLNDYWSLSVTSGLRIIYFLNEDNIYIFGIGTHDQVYKR